MNGLPKRLMVGGAVALLIGAILELMDRSSARRAPAPAKSTLGDLMVQRSIGTAERVRDRVADALVDSGARVEETDIAGPATAGVDAVVDRVTQMRETARQHLGSASSGGKDALTKAAADVKQEAAMAKTASKRRAGEASASTKKAAATTKKKATASTAKAKQRSTRASAAVKGRAVKPTDSANGAVSPKDS
jgi:hypothetical protein